MKAKDLVLKWFELWESGNFRDLPLSENFKHTSPYGTIQGKKAYLDLVEDNREKFLEHSFEIHDLIDYEKKCCIRYTAHQGSFKLEVSEWHYIENDLINEVVAYYNIQGGIDEERKIDYPKSSNSES